MKKTDFLLFLLILLMILSGTLAYFGSTEDVASVVPVVADSRDTVELPVLMYHGITDLPASVSEYTILQDTFEQDLKWLGDHGFTSVSLQQLIDYTEKGKALPDKPVLITFDDGYINNYTFAFPLLQKYHMKAVISVIGREADISSVDMYRKLSNSSLSWGEIALLSNSENVEIGSHTYNLHTTSKGRKGADKKASESQKEYEAVLKEDLTKSRDKITESSGISPVLFAWPYGAYPKDGSADKVLKELGFKISVTSYQKTNVIEKGNPDSLFGLKRFLRTPDFDMNKII